MVWWVNDLACLHGSVGLIPGLGTFVRHGCGRKKKKEKKGMHSIEISLKE